MTSLLHVALLRDRQMRSVFRSPADLTAMRHTRPCFGDDPYEVEGHIVSGKPAVPEYHLVLSDFVLNKPDATGKCRLRYNRTGALLSSLGPSYR